LPIKYGDRWRKIEGALVLAVLLSGEVAYCLNRLIVLNANFIPEDFF
jgi:hypothetical protein